MPSSSLVLASTSPARHGLLRALGLAFDAVPPEVEEDLPEDTPPEQAVALLAERKARAVAARHPQALVIGSDQLVSLDGRAFGKPPDRTAAAAQLRALRGRTHDIVTGVCVMGPSTFACEVDVARLTVYPLPDEELERYLDLEEWRGCAGGYRVEGAGQALFARIEGDRTGVQGLPMVRLVRMLREAGVTFFA